MIYRMASPRVGISFVEIEFATNSIPTTFFFNKINHIPHITKINGAANYANDTSKGISLEIETHSPGI